MKQKVNLDQIEIDPDKREKIMQDIIEGKISKEEVDELGLPKEEYAIIGENKEQLFVRIPMKIKDKLNLKAGQKVRFKVYTKNGKQKLEIEVI